VSRRGYTVALVVAVVVLVGSMAMTALYAGAHGALRGTGGHGGTGWGPGPMYQGQQGADDVSPAAAQQIATNWLAANQPGAQLGTGVTMPMGYVFPVTRSGATVGMLVVGDRDGQVRYREFAAPSPAPSPSTTA
jgi:hypothetical protein